MMGALHGYRTVYSCMMICDHTFILYNCTCTWNHSEIC